MKWWLLLILAACSSQPDAALDFTLVRAPGVANHASQTFGAALDGGDVALSSTFETDSATDPVGVVCRVHADVGLDPDFGDRGCVSFPGAHMGPIATLGDAIVAARMTGATWDLVKLDASGQVDASFSVPLASRPSAILAESGGTDLVVVGTRLVRIDSTGAVLLTGPDLGESLSGAQLTSDGSVISLGSDGTSGGKLVRVRPSDLALDDTFGTGGVLGTQEADGGLGILDNGDIALERTGVCDSWCGFEVLDPTGAPDRTFGTLAPEILYSGAAHAYRGGVVVGGTVPLDVDDTSDKLELAAFDGDGAPDPTDLSLPEASGVMWSMLSTSDGATWAIGSLYSGDIFAVVLPR